MIRTLIPLALFFLFLITGSPAHAQTCTPACGTGQDCVYTSNADTDTTCIKAADCSSGTCAVEGITVTATQKSASTPTGPTFANAANSIVGFVNQYVIPLMYALAFLFFVAGLVRHFFLEGGEEGVDKGKQMAIYGLIGLAVIFSVWGLVNVLLTTLNSLAGT